MEMEAEPREKTTVPNVRLTGRSVDGLNASAYVPPGCRMASLEEVALAYKERPSFKKELHDLSSGAWVGKTRLDSSGPQKIKDNGDFVGVTHSEYKALGAESRSWHYPGVGPVAVSSFYYGRYGIRGLFVSANVRPDFLAKVAYVSIAEEEKRLQELLELARKDQQSRKSP